MREHGLHVGKRAHAADEAHGLLWDGRLQRRALFEVVERRVLRLVDEIDARELDELDSEFVELLQHVNHGFMVARMVFMLCVEVDFDEHGEILAAFFVDALDDFAHDAEAVLGAAAIRVRTLVERRVEEAREQIRVRGMELDAVDARILEPSGGQHEVRFDAMNLVHRQLARMAVLLEVARCDIREVVNADGARPGMGNLRHEFRALSVRELDSLAELVDVAVIEDVDLLLVRAAERIDAAVARDDEADAVLCERLVHRVFLIRHAAVFRWQEAVRGRADDAVLEGEVRKLQWLFDGAHETCSFQNNLQFVRFYDCV